MPTDIDSLVKLMRETDPERFMEKPIAPTRKSSPTGTPNGSRSGSELAAVRGMQERTASVEEMEALLAVLPVQDRALWATAFYGGLRLGELRALRFADSI